MKKKKRDYSLTIGLMAIGILLLATLAVAVSLDNPNDTYQEMYQGMMDGHMHNMYNGGTCGMMQGYDDMVDENGDGLCDMCGMPLEDCEEIMGDSGINATDMYEHCPMMG